jgi:hypothetical protein
MQPCGEDLTATELRMRRVAGLVNDLEMQEPPEHVGDFRLVALPATPDLRERGRIAEAPVKT